MDADELRTMIARGESLTVEFKAKANDTSLVEAVVCLANGSGGHLLVGVDDRGEVVGAPPRHGAATVPAQVEALITNRTEPALLAPVEVVDIGNEQVIVVAVPRASDVVATKDGKYVRRTIDVEGRPQCLPMRPHEVLARAATVGARDHSRMAMPGLTLDDLDEVEFARLRTLARAGGDSSLASLSNLEVLKALDLLAVTDELTVGALLLFGQEAAINRLLPVYEVGFQELAGLKVRAKESRRLPLLRAMTELADRVQARNPQEEVEVGLFRVPLPRFAEVAVRELIANALVHRDYTAKGETLVEVTSEALTVSNPGGFPEGVTLDNLLTTPPRPRNPALADAFKRAGLVDRTSRGINRVFEAQLALGRPAPDYSRSTRASVVARVRSGPADKELAAFIAETLQSGQELTLDDLLALHEVRLERRITSARAAELFQVDLREARAVLNRLADRGLLEARGEGKGRVYHLAAALYRRLGEPGQYVRTRGFEDIQQEQMVLSFVQRHGSITRHEAAELCQVDPTRASRLLRRLRDRGQLALVGERRGAHYVQPEGD